MDNHTEYRLAFILPESRQLLGIQNSGDIELPRISVPMWQRPAEQLTRLIEETWNIRTLVLDLLCDSPISTPCAVIEVRSSSWQFTRRGLTTVHLGNIGRLSLSGDERAALLSILSGSNTSRSPFALIGWINEAQEWIHTAIRDHDVIFTDEMRHLNAGGEFCLLRLETIAGPAYWLKAVGRPNAHEFGVTAYLAAVCPEYLPPILAIRADWRAWLMEEYGISLHSSSSLEHFKRAAFNLANLQRRLIGRSADLLDAGCGDHRIGVLRAHIDNLIEYLDYAMSQQTSTKVPPVSASRLNKIGHLLHETCSAMEDLNIPDSLLHNDISPGSILTNGLDCVFTDWCEAYVGNPFITQEQLCVHASRKSESSQHWSSALKAVYRSVWSKDLSEHQVERALQLAPLLSVLSYLHGRGDWLETSRRTQPAFLSYSRSLARHMDRIANSAELREALCQLN